VTTFKINDMMVTLLPRGVHCGEGDWGHHTRHKGSIGCGMSKDACCADAAHTKPRDIEDAPADELAKLRQQLANALAQVGAKPAKSPKKAKKAKKTAKKNKK
jgi:hypothetical protein